MENVLITGGAGFIGSHIAKLLKKNGFNITIYDNLSSGKLTNLKEIEDDINFIEGDILDRNLLDKSLKGIDYVFHEAALVSVFDSVEKPFLNQRINENGMLNVFELSKKNNIKKIVCASSAAVYGDSLVLPKNENMKTDPKSPYGISKNLMELYAKVYTELYNLPIVCLRYFNVYGPNQDPNSPYSGVLSIFSKLYKSDNPSLKIYGDGKQTRDFIYVKDVALANLLVLKSNKMNGKIFNVGTGIQTSLLDIIDVMNKISNKQADIEFFDERQGDIKYSVSSIDNIKKYGFKPEYILESGLNEYLKEIL